MQKKNDPPGTRKDQEVRARLAAILDASEDAIISKTLDGVITAWSKASERIYGYSAPEVIGRSIAMLAPAGHRDKVSQILERIRRGEHVKHFETVHTKKDGTLVQVRVTVSPVVDERGHVIGASSIARNITEEKRKEQAHREHLKNEERLAIALDAVGMGSCDMNTASGAGIWSRQHFLLLGYQPPRESIAPATTKMWQELIHPEDRERVARELEDALRLQALFRSEHRLQRADSGQLIWVNVLGRFLDDHGRIANRFIGVISDVTERKKAQEELAQAHRVADQKAAEAEEGRKVLDALMNNLPDGIAIFDANCMLLRISRYGLELAGQDQTALQKLTVAERAEKIGVFLPDGVTRVPVEDTPLVRAIRSGQVVKDCELMLRNAQGRTVPILANAGPIRDRNGKISGAVVAWHDITARKEMEQKLRASEERYRTLVEWAPDAIVVHRNGHFLYVNCPALGIYGAVTREQLQRKNFIDLVHPEDLDAVKLQLKQIQDGEKMLPHEFKVVRTDGQIVTVESAGIVIEYEGAPAFLFILRDMTERKRMEQERLWALEELRTREQLLIKQGRFAAMGEMVSNIAHQWRQPLNILGLIVQELPVYYKLGKFDQQYLEASADKAMQTISHMSRTIDEFRNFFSPDKEKVRFRMDEVVHKTVSLLEAAFREPEVKIEVQIEDEVLIDGYPNEYSQVILNILMNAKDALLERKTEHPMVVLKLFREHGKAVLTITDNAGGIPEEIIGKVFDPYFTTKSPDRGTGIGLFMSKTIIEKNMSGSLNVRNVTGGAQFRIEV